MQIIPMPGVTHLLLRSGPRSSRLACREHPAAQGRGEHRADANELHLGEVEESPQPGPGVLIPLRQSQELRSNPTALWLSTKGVTRARLRGVFSLFPNPVSRK